MNLRKQVVNIVILAIIALSLVNLWSEPGKIIAYAESGIPIIYNLDKMNELRLHPWSDAFGTGSENMMQIVSTPLYRTMNLLKDFDLTARQAILHFTILFSSGLSTYFLVNDFYKGKHRRFVSLTSGIFYMLNPYMMIYVWNRLIAAFLVPTLIPLSLLLYRRLLYKKNNWYALTLALLFSYFAIYFTVITFVPFFMILVFYIFDSIKRNNWKENTRYTAIFFGMFFITNAWYLLPIGLNLSGKVTRVTTANLQAAGLGKFSAIDYVTMFLPFPDFSKNWEYYANPFVKIVNYLMVLFAFTYIRKPRKDISFFFTLLIVSFLIPILAHSRIQFIFDFITRTVPFATVFVNTLLSEKIGFLITLSYSVLIPIGILELMRLVPSGFKKSYLVLTYFLLFVILVLPMWTGSVFEHKSITSPYIHIPDYYKNAKSFLEEDGIGNSRIAMLPFIPGDGYKLIIDNEIYSGATLDWEIFDNPVIISTTSNAKPYREFLLNFDYNNTLSEVLAISNVKYAILRHDMNTLLTKTESAQFVKGVLESDEEINYRTSFGQLDIYQVKEPLPKIFTTNNVVFISDYNDVKTLLMDKEFFDYRKEIFTEEIDVDNFVSKQIISSSEKSLGAYPLDSYEGVYNILYTANNDLLVDLIEEGVWRYNVANVAELSQNNSFSIDNSNPFEYYSRFNITLPEESILNLNYLLDGVSNLSISTSCGMIRYNLLKSVIYIDDKIEMPPYECILENITITVLPQSTLDVSKLELRVGGEKYINKIFENVSLNYGVNEIDFGELIYNFTAKGIINDSVIPRIDEANFTRISPSEYIVDVNTNEKTILVFLETFDDAWSIYDENVNEINTIHFMANGYANAWVINDSYSGKITIKNKKVDDIVLGVNISKFGTLLIFTILIFGRIIIWN